MRSRTVRGVAAFGLTLAIAGAVHWWFQYDRHTYLTGDTAAFVAIFAAPANRGSPATRAELDELLELQKARTATEIAAARADRKTEIQRFYGALGFSVGAKPDLPRLRTLAARVEDDTRPYVRAAKEKFRRLRPYEIEPRIEPCIDNVRGDLSYPSGHATYGYVMAYLLRDMVPERDAQLISRADEFARQRMVCGVHFSTDIDAGRRGAQWLIFALDADPGFRNEAHAATVELRAALHLAPKTPRTP